MYNNITINENGISLDEIEKYTEKYYRDFISNNIFEKYICNALDNKSIASIREDLRGMIESAKNYKVNITDLFPVCVEAGANILVKFYQTGEVYMHNQFENNITYLFGTYGSDSICQDR